MQEESHDSGSFPAGWQAEATTRPDHPGSGRQGNSPQAKQFWTLFSDAKVAIPHNGFGREGPGRISLEGTIFFNSGHPYSPMEEITGTDRVKEGIMLRVKTKTGEEEVLFEFRDLIAMKVNALHLLQFPHKYLCDPQAMIIVRKPRGNRNSP